MEIWRILIPVLVFGAGIVWTVTWWLVKRMIDGYAERLGAVETGMRNHAIALLDRPTRAELAAEMTSLRDVITGFRADTQRYEDRMLAALREHNSQMREDIAGLRTEIRGVHARVDAIVNPPAR